MPQKENPNYTLIATMTGMTNSARSVAYKILADEKNFLLMRRAGAVKIGGPLRRFRIELATVIARNPKVAIYDEDGHTQIICRAGIGQDAAVRADIPRTEWTDWNDPRFTKNRGNAEVHMSDQSHTPRRAMVRPERERLSGNIEVDKTLIGGEDHDGKRGRGAGRKSIVVISVEVHKLKGFERIRMQRIPDASGWSLIAFVCNSVELGATILTDSWRGYNALPQNGYTHKKVNLSESGDPAHVVMPGAHKVSSLLKRWIFRTLQGSISDKHFDYYLDEYTFRFNRRNSKARGFLFYRLLQQAAMITPVTYRELVGGKI